VNMPLPRSILSLAEQELLLKKARSELREEQMLQTRPDVPAWRKNLAARFEASLRAEVKQRKKALLFYRKLHKLQNT
jgi:hypothetical protein